MKASAGKPKVLMLAFGHPENVLSLCKAVSRKVQLELVFVVAKEQFREGIVDIDISSMRYGLNSYHESINFLPQEIKRFIGSSFKIRFIRTPSRSLFKDRALKNLKTVYRSARALKKESYDVIHFNGVSGFTAYFKLFLGIKTKYIWTIHDYIPHSGEGRPWSKVLLRLTMMMGFEYIQHYRWLRNRFIKYFKVNPAKVHHVYSGQFSVFRQFKPVRIDGLNNYILFFGRISPYKGIDSLIAAFLKYKELNPASQKKLCIAGSGKLWFQNNILEHPDIIFINRYIKTGELVYLIKNCCFVTLPYTDSTHSAVVMTSYAFNKPVIATDVGGLHEVVISGRTGYLVPENDINELADAIHQLSSGDKRLEQFSNNIASFKNDSHISWDKIALKMQAIYSAK
jgi:glycosyltransferase involved in cell wall biosynthesis